MNILMMTNTYLPHVGGVARSVEWFSKGLRSIGHNVMVVAPEFENMPEKEENVVRIPALQNFNGSDFSVTVPIPGFLRYHINEFNPHIIHSHHPFLLGSTAVRIANQRQIPLVFTYHTNYEQYTHYVPGDFPRMKKFAIQLAKGYCNLADHVVTPSESIAEILRERGVKTPMTCIPTGIRIDEFSSGNGRSFRKRYGIPEGCFVVGHVGRLAPEKNLRFLARAVREFMKDDKDSLFLVVGDGPSAKTIRDLFVDEKMSDRLIMTGKLDKQELVDAYHGMDVFAFASKSETQGMVLAEAMGASTPVVAIDAPGAREVVEDGKNGFLLYDESVESFSVALSRIRNFSEKEILSMRDSAFSMARSLDLSRCVRKLSDLYSEICGGECLHDIHQESFWESAMDQLRVEWDLMRNLAEAAASSFMDENDKR
jgi:glycosyltransferase involved in cell wall biosynthesis